MNKLVSIIMPMYNSANYIIESIESVIKQTYINWELLLIDDKSIDNTLQIIKQYDKKDDRIKIIRLDKNYGPSVARNEGLANMVGQYVAFLDSDDKWLPNKLENQVKFMLKNDYKFSYSAYQKIDSNGNFLRKYYLLKNKINYIEILKTNHIVCSSVIIDVALLENKKMKNISKRQDYILWLSILKEGYIAHGINEVLIEYRVHAKSISKNKLKMAVYQWYVYRKIEKISYLYSIYNMIFYIYHGLRKNIFV